MYSSFKRITITTVAASCIMHASNAFAPTISTGLSQKPTLVGNAMSSPNQFLRILPLHSSLTEMEQEVETKIEEVSSHALKDDDQQTKTPRAAPKKKAAGPAAHGKEGPLSPVVLAAKAVMGDESQFNKLRAKVISIHSDVIEGFILQTSDTALGRAVLQRLFSLADQDHSGSIEASELKHAFQVIGFDWLKDKQVEGIFQRADKNENGHLELEEWLAEAPKTLRTNLIKLAKKNGGELGLLV